MKQHSIINITKDFEDLIIIKNKIDDINNEKNGTNIRTSIEDFIVGLNMNYSVFVHADEVIPFSIVEVEDHDYIFCVIDNNDNVDIFEKMLKNIDYDISNLTKVNMNTILENDNFFKSDHFLINGEYAIKE